MAQDRPEHRSYIMLNRFGGPTWKPKMIPKSNPKANHFQAYLKARFLRSEISEVPNWSNTNPKSSFFLSQTNLKIVLSTKRGLSFRVLEHSIFVRTIFGRIRRDFFPRSQDSSLMLSGSIVFGFRTSWEHQKAHLGVQTLIFIASGGLLGPILKVVWGLCSKKDSCLLLVSRSFFSRCLNRNFDAWDFQIEVFA